MPEATTIPSASGNGQSTASNSPPFLGEGIYVPTVAFFTPEDTIDIETTKLHARRIAEADIAGLVTHGSNGEAVHLDRKERQTVTRATRAALDLAGKTHLPVIAGCGAQSTRETIQLCTEAAESGASYALVLPPAYYGGLVTSKLMLQHFRDVADASPIPVLVYNFPGACAGFDLSSDAIIALSQHANIVGVKLTCGNTGKLARVVKATKGTAFRTFGGSVDFTLQTLSVGGHGIIGGLANVAPRACAELFKLWSKGGDKQRDEAQALQGVVADADWVAIKGGFVAVKVALQHYHGYGGLPRRPCALPEEEEREEQIRGFEQVMAVERRLQ